ncbi:C-terminal binding protein [Gordonia sp. SL306]|uniref:C-terminal binding protein n=1 Tax=Gordonia sp. SL306 TaxID=2995145 RepID=UPI002271C209|nr:C-terminal binding protein [Gordonia sp. SL306]WAC57160.1 C-terminal binding protein [Gordonia sp. SL306]
MSLRILITDHPGATIDVEREVLSAIDAEIVVAPATDSATLATLAGDVDAIITCFAQVTADVLEAAVRCRTVARTGVGVDNIDVKRATELGMVVSNVPEYCTDEVADHTLMLVLALARRLPPLVADTASGGWNRNLTAVPTRLRGKTLALLGTGAIGWAVTSRAQAIGLEVVTVERGRPVPAGVRTVPTVIELLRTADVVSLHLPLTAETAGIIDREALTAMKPTAVLVNTARGALIDTDALTEALAAGQIAGAALDVTEPEPLPAGHPLRALPTAILTPHIAFSSDGSLADLSRKAATNVLDALSGRVPASVVNPEIQPDSERRTQAGER